MTWGTGCLSVEKNLKAPQGTQWNKDPFGFRKQSLFAVSHLPLLVLYFIMRIWNLCSDCDPPPAAQLLGPMGPRHCSFWLSTPTPPSSGPWPTESQCIDLSLSLKWTVWEVNRATWFVFSGHGFRSQTKLLCRPISEVYEFPSFQENSR